jgi:hypothetical protein
MTNLRAVRDSFDDREFHGVKIEQTLDLHTITNFLFSALHIIIDHFADVKSSSK